MLFEALETARDLGRLHEIASVLVRHGLGDLVRRVGLAGVLERAGRVLHWRGAEALATTPTPVHLRRALEELGPTFVKFGQLLADREDVVGPEWCAELRELKENVAPAPSEEVLAQLAEDLGGAPGAVLASFDPTPIAAGSIAQVLRARLASGEEVVLKVRRPGIREVVEADLRLLVRFAERLESEVPELRRYRPRALVRSFARTLRDELDLRLEARNAERLRDVLSDEDRILIPRSFPALSNERLLVLELVPGVSLVRHLRERTLSAEEARELARRGAHAVLRMVFGAGFFHADPHAGNLIVVPDGRLALLDFGQVGRLAERRKRELFDLAQCVVRRDEEAAVDVLLGWAVRGDVDVPRLTMDCAILMDRYASRSLEELAPGRVLQDVAALLRENDLQLPSDVAALLKLFVTLEAVGSALDPGFVMSAMLVPFAERELRHRRSPRRVLARGARELAGMLSALPDDTRSLLRRLRRGDVRVNVGVQHLEQLSRSIDQSSSRLTLGLVTAALIVGTAIAIDAPAGPRLFGVSVLGLLGFLTSLATGLWVLRSVYRSAR